LVISFNTHSYKKKVKKRFPNSRPARQTSDISRGRGSAVTTKSSFCRVVGSGGSRVKRVKGMTVEKKRQDHWWLRTKSRNVGGGLKRGKSGEKKVKKFGQSGNPFTQ